MDLSAVTLGVLAGGQGRRMGTPKALLRVQGKAILQWQLDRLAWPGPRLLITAPVVANPPGMDLFDAVAVDPVDGLGPLRGILTALENLKSELVVIIPVDMPNITRDQLAWLVEHCSASSHGVACRDQDGEIQPLPMVLTKSAAVIVRQNLDSVRLALRDLLREDGFVTVPADWPADTWMNLNDPQALRLFEDLGRKES